MCLGKIHQAQISKHRGKKTAHQSPIIYSAGFECNSPSQCFEKSIPQSQEQGEVKYAAWVPLSFPGLNSKPSAETEELSFSLDIVQGG